MVTSRKTIVSRSQYVAPMCKLYSINVESVIAQSPGYGTTDAPGDDMGGGNTYDGL